MTASSGGDLNIREAEGAADMKAVRELFIEFQGIINVDLCFQGFDEELATLPGRYARPLGRLFLAMDGDEAVGVTGLRPMGDGVAEMKRLYLRPPWRGSGLGGASRRSRRRCSPARPAQENLPGYSRFHGRGPEYVPLHGLR